MTVACDDAVVVLGAARGDGNTRATVDSVFGAAPIHRVDLCDLRISTYDYSNANSADDFIPLIESLLPKSLWVLATPVYWYTMSAPMKIFFDRLSDLLSARKDLGRQLRQKSVAVVACGADPVLPAGFETPFQLTCDYLGMQYVGSFYLPFTGDNQPLETSLAKAREYGASLIAHPSIAAGG